MRDLLKVLHIFDPRQLPAFPSNVQRTSGRFISTWLQKTAILRRHHTFQRSVEDRLPKLGIVTEGYIALSVASVDIKRSFPGMGQSCDLSMQYSIFQLTAE